MKKFSEIKESKTKRTNDSVKNEILDILEELNVKVSGEDSEKLSNVDIDIQGKDEIVEKLKSLVDNIRIQERKNTLNTVKAKSYQNFSMKWLNEQIDGLDKIKIGKEIVLSEKLSNSQLGDEYRADLKDYFVNNLNGQDINGWEFNNDSSGIFDFKLENMSIKVTPFYENSDSISYEVYKDEEMIDDGKEPYNIEEILYKKYKEFLDMILMLPDNEEGIPIRTESEYKKDRKKWQ